MNDEWIRQIKFIEGTNSVALASGQRGLAIDLSEISNPNATKKWEQKLRCVDHDNIVESIDIADFINAMFIKDSVWYKQKFMKSKNN